MPQKRICIIGASAGVGLHCVQVALERGHKVVSLSRSIDTLPKHPQLQTVQGSATQAPDVHRAVQGCDAVLVCLGTGKSMKATTLYSEFGKVLLTLTGTMGKTPLIVLTGFGASESAQYHGWLVARLFRLFLADVYADKTVMENTIVNSPLNWMLVRPGVLTNGRPKGPARVQTDYHHGMKVGSISRRSVAEFMVSQAEHPTLLKQKPALSAR